MAPLRGLLAWRPLRRRVVFELLQRYHAELELAVPLGHGMKCPIVNREAWASFEHIFFAGEYDGALERVPLPQRWLDLGCYAGFYSLYVVWRRAEAGLSGAVEALLVDGDSRAEAAVAELVARNGLEGQLRFSRGLIASGEGSAGFVERAYTRSQVEVKAGAGEELQQVPIMTPARIAGALEGPYDLIKVDVEGGEYEFLRGYGEVLRQARHVILEWHGWHAGGGGEEQLMEMMSGHDFRLVAKVLEPCDAAYRQGANLSGVHLYERVEP
jgi:FkbM family methyltransferase